MIDVLPIDGVQGVVQVRLRHFLGVELRKAEGGGRRRPSPKTRAGTVTM